MLRNFEYSKLKKARKLSGLGPDLSFVFKSVYFVKTIRPTGLEPCTYTAHPSFNHTALVIFVMYICITQKSSLFNKAVSI